MADWTPALTTTEAWYDASDESSISEDDAAGRVSQIDDLSGNGEHITQTTASMQPETGTRTINSLNVIDFDGIAHQMNNGSFPILSSGDVKILGVYVIDGVAIPADSIWSMQGTDDVQFDADSTTQFDGRINVDGLGSDVSLTGGPFAGPSIYNMNLDFSGAGIYNAFIDGTQRAVNTTYSTKLSTSQDLKIMANRNGAQELDGAWGELIFIENLTTAERQRIEGYLAHKWGIEAKLPSGHPYENGPPQTEYTWDGGHATLNAWSEGDNWVGDAAPQGGLDEILIFTGSTRLAPNNNISADSAFEDILFTSGAGLFVISGNGITLNGDILKTGTTNQQEFNCDVIIPSGNHTLGNTTAGALVFVDSVWSGAGSIVKTGSNDVTFEGDGTNNPFTGSIDIQGSGILWFDFAPINNTSGVTIGSGTRFRIGRLTLSANITNNGGTLELENGFGTTVSGNIANGSDDLTIEYVFTTQLISGVISGSGNLTLVSSTSGSLDLSGNNTYTGNTTISSGNVETLNNNALGVNSAIIFADVASAVLDIGFGAVQVGSLAGGGAAGGNIELGNKVLTIGGDNSNTTYNGIITDDAGPGPGGIIKIGTGKQIFTGIHIYWLNTNVNAGTLIVNGEQYQNDEIQVNSGATIGGNGIIKGDLNINAGGILSPGDGSTATLTVATTGGHDLKINSATAKLLYTLGTSSDKVVIGPAASSGLTLDGTIDVTAGAGFAAGTFDIITYPVGNLTDNGLTIGVLPVGFNAVVNDTGTIIQLIITAEGGGGLVNSNGLVNNNSLVSSGGLVN